MSDHGVKTPQKKVSVRALMIILCFTICVILITCMFRFWSAFLASYVLVLLIINGILFILVSKSNRPQKSADSILDREEINKVAKLLRYATAVLSFISLMTTAKGLQDIVFSENEAWLAYLASFAVQAILVSFSLTYCHIHAAIRSVTTLSDRGKTLMTGMLTLFLAIAFIVSSSFSFSYIANNAYARSWPNDSEVLIEGYLRQSVSDLETENGRIGGLVYEQIKTYNELLSGAIDDYTKTQNVALVDTVTKFGLSKDVPNSLEPDNSDHGFGLTNDIVQAWRSRYSAQATQIDGLVGQFDLCVTNLNSLRTDYEQMANDLDIYDDANAGDWALVKTKLDGTYTELKALSRDLSSLITRTKGLYIYAIDRDISPYRTALSTAAQDLMNFVDDRAIEVDNLKTQVSQAATGYLAGSNGGSLPDEIETLQKKIYMLNTAYTSNGTVAGTTSAEDIINELSSILATYVNDNTLSSKTVAYILELEALVKEYEAYITLSDDIEKYISSDLAVTYNIISETEETESENENLGSVIDVTYDQWVSARDQDFLQFFSLLKDLPTEPGQEAVFFETAESESGNLVAEDSAEYIAEDVLYEANILRRDLLGNTTDFERAFNYFKYDFKAMAFFSAFIAAFFDLGAFLTGCFLYGIRHFEVKEDGGENETSD